jgi:hypothetical protein
MDAPDLQDAELEMVNAGSDKSKAPTGSKRYRAKNKGRGKSKGHSNYQGGGLNSV